jgi:serine/threonine protein phosphatase PrpC
MYPGLSISRSLGDILAHEIGVISTPDVIEHNVSNDLFLIIGSGGIWDHISTEEAVELATRYKEAGS